MSPLVFLSIMVGLPIGAWMIHQIRQFRRRRRLRQLASEWRMGYAPNDLFNLPARIAAQFPVSNVSQVRTLDVIYGSEGQRHRYVFTAEYTRPIDGDYEREQRVMTFCEPRDGPVASDSSSLVAAPEGLSLLDQYRHLKDHAWGEPSPLPNGAAA